ncbi:MAG: alanine racemase [Myxococcaceae bacterium]
MSQQSHTPPRRRALDLPIRPTRAEIDLEALKGNLAAIRSLAPKVDVLAVVKANAYGHGAVEIAHALEGEAVRFLGVAIIEEALELRHAGVKAPILVLGGSYDRGYELIVELGLIPTIFREDHLAELSAAAKRQRKKVKAHLKIDTGMGRIGVLPDALPSFLETAKKFPEVELDGLLSHFANADLKDQALTGEQLRKFKTAHAQMKAAGYFPSFRHLSNSAGVLDVPEVRDGLELNLIRPGLILYGVEPASWLKGRAALRPVLSWKTGVTFVKTVPKGTPISYGGTFVTKRESVIATLPIGYADGYDRGYSSKASVLIRGKRAPIAGRVCMDMVMADVTDIPGVAVGDEVVLLGRQGSEEIPVEELASLSETIPYEVLCGVGARVPRVSR